MLEQDDLPYSEPTSLLQDAANASTSLLRSGLFEKQLTLAFWKLQVQRIEIHARLRKAAADLAPGLSHLVQQTGRDPFKDVLFGVKPSWEYRTTDMVTCLTQQVISALLQSQMPVSALVTDSFQSDRLTLCPTLLASAQDLKRLTRLVLRIGLYSRNSMTTESANQNPDFDLFTLVNNLPCLEELSLASGPKSDDNTPLPLNKFLTRLSLSRKVQKLDLRVIRDAAPELPAIFASLPPSLKRLGLSFSVDKDLENTPWNAMFSELRGLLTQLEHLVIGIGSIEFRAKGKDKIDQRLEWLAKNMPEYGEEEDDEDDDDDDEDEEEDQRPKFTKECIRIGNRVFMRVRPI
ncbi:hypothetical protein KCU77_g5467, partial [Aureobasidium melanogenum]